MLEKQKRNYRALSVPEQTKAGQKLHRSAHRKTDRKPSDVPLNSGEGLRAAYFTWTGILPSYSSLKEHIKQNRPAVPGVAARGDDGGKPDVVHSRQPAVSGGGWRSAFRRP